MRNAYNPMFKENVFGMTMQHILKVCMMLFVGVGGEEGQTVREVGRTVLVTFSSGPLMAYRRWQWLQLLPQVLDLVDLIHRHKDDLMAAICSDYHKNAQKVDHNHSHEWRWIPHASTNMFPSPSPSLRTQARLEVLFPKARMVQIVVLPYSTSWRRPGVLKRYPWDPESGKPIWNLF